MGPGRSHDRFAAGFVAFLVFVIVLTMLSSCQPRVQSRGNAAPQGAINATMK